MCLLVGPDTRRIGFLQMDRPAIPCRETRWLPAELALCMPVAIQLVWLGFVTWGDRATPGAGLGSWHPAGVQAAGCGTIVTGTEHSPMVGMFSDQQEWAQSPW